MTNLFNSLPKVGFIGLARSGKGLATDTVINNFNFVSVTISSIIKDYAKEQGRELKTRDEYWEVGTELNKKFGEVYLFEKATENLMDQIQNHPSIRGVIYDGMRRPHLIEEFKKMNNALIIKIEASVDIRFKRKHEARPEDVTVTLEQFNNNEAKEAEIVKLLDKYADITIINERSKVQFEKEIMEIIKKHFKLEEKND